MCFPRNGMTEEPGRVTIWTRAKNIFVFFSPPHNGFYQYVCKRQPLAPMVVDTQSVEAFP